MCPSIRSDHVPVSETYMLPCLSNAGVLAERKPSGSGPREYTLHLPFGVMRVILLPGLSHSAQYKFPDASTAWPRTRRGAVDANTSPRLVSRSSRYTSNV